MQREAPTYICTNQCVLIANKNSIDGVRDAINRLTVSLFAIFLFSLEIVKEFHGHSILGNTHHSPRSSPTAFELV